MPWNGPPIVVKNVTMAYESLVVMRDLNFEVKEGEIFVIMGGSGSGKSTLLRHMIGLHKPTSGQVLFEGEDFYSADEKKQQQLLCRMGVLYQNGALWSDLTLGENISLPLEQYTSLRPRDRQEIVELKLALVGLRGFESYYPSEISGGMRKRAALARAMALDPDVLFFDEPSSGLDPITANRLDNLILELRDSLGTTVVVVSHDLESIFAVADRAVFLDIREKSITAIGNPIELREDPPSPEVARFLTRSSKVEDKTEDE